MNNKQLNVSIQILSAVGNNQSGKGKGQSDRHEVRQVVGIAEDYVRTPVFT